MIAPSTLSLAALALRNQIGKCAKIDVANILLGHPAHVTPASSAQAVSIYFFHAYVPGNSGAVDPTMPLDTIVHCLITPLGVATTAPGAGGDDISSGENDLRLLGQIMRCMHENPLLRVADANAAGICEVEITPLELTIDDLSRIVPTAPATGGFRPSVAYALALLPLPCGKERVHGVPVQVVTYGVDANDADPTRSFPQQGYVGITARPGRALPGENSPLPHMQLENEAGQNVYFRRISAHVPKTDVNVTVSIPAAHAVHGDTVKVTQHLWDPENLDYILVKEEPALPLTSSNGDWRVTKTWTLDSAVAGQHLFRVEREVGGESLGGNICMIVAAPASASP